MIFKIHFNIILHPPTLKIEAMFSCKMLVDFLWTTWHYVTEYLSYDSVLHSGNEKSTYEVELSFNSLI
jgi:hypothetical protein